MRRYPRLCSRCGHYFSRRHRCPAVAEAKELLNIPAVRREANWISLLNSASASITPVKLAWKTLGTINRITAM